MFFGVDVPVSPAAFASAFPTHFPKKKRTYPSGHKKREARLVKGLSNSWRKKACVHMSTLYSHVHKLVCSCIGAQTFLDACVLIGCSCRWSAMVSPIACISEDYV